MEKVSFKNSSSTSHSRVIPWSLCVCCRVWLFVTPWTVAFPAPLFMGFSSKSTGVGCHSFLQGIFWTRDQTRVSYTVGRLFHAEPPRKPTWTLHFVNKSSVETASSDPELLFICAWAVTLRAGLSQREDSLIVTTAQGLSPGWWFWEASDALWSPAREWASVDSPSVSAVTLVVPFLSLFSDSALMWTSKKHQI